MSFSQTALFSPLVHPSDASCASCGRCVHAPMLFLVHGAPDKCQHEASLAELQASIKARTLNPSQASAVQSSIHRTVSLWQGPPGTGKTTTLIQFIKVRCRKRLGPKRLYTMHVIDMHMC